jgi:hypothetical protein
MPPRRQSSDIEATISAIVARATADIAGAIRAELALQLQNVTAGVPAELARALQQHVAVPTPRTGTRQRGRLDEATVSRVWTVIRDAPGLRTEQIQTKLPVAPNVVKAALAKLRRENRVKTTGQRRGMTYAAR